ncbi:regulating synaptic membrane exocytosis protein 2 isoform X7 [Scyliorhinus canicula]|uniref:regulating synaptic membrane exocytosis protein 2 isoform X7 n=1 Tax=Scyliorhinus canicula TaxID=7830 RepID=UPI0018F6DFDF|nr:regulating synaptic membrane exocytosis protein 2 isoform X7 [Scyliorhinus canicula]
MSAPLGPRGPRQPGPGPPHPHPSLLSPAAPPPPPPAAAASPASAADMSDMPDLSHLTEEERKIILAVMDRQRQEEEKEQSMLRVKEEQKPQQPQWFPFSGITELVNNVLQPQQKQQNEKEPQAKLHQQFEMYKDQVKKMGDEAQQQQEQKSDAPTCGICHKTKFADGCGHICSYCQTKFCARCGGRVSLRSNKEDKVVMWVCNLCRKQQEILTKSGAWFYSPNTPQEADPTEATVGVPHGNEEAPQEKKAKLQEHSQFQGPLPSGDISTPASDKNRPQGLTRQDSIKNGSEVKQHSMQTASELTTERKRSPSTSREHNRQYDQRDERADPSQYALLESAMQRSPTEYADRDKRSLRGSRIYDDSEHIEYRESRDSGRRSRRRSQECRDFVDEDIDVQTRDEYERQRREEEYQTRYRSDPNLARYPVKPQPYEEQMRMHAEVSRARHERRHSDVSLAYTEMDDAQVSMHRMERQSRQRSACDRRVPVQGQRSYSMERTQDMQGPSSSWQRTPNHSPPTPRRSPIPFDRSDMRRSDSLRQQHHLDPSSAVKKTKREKMETMLRNDSLSSDQSESVRPPPPKPHKTKKGGKTRQVSLSSSEEELASTPEYTSCDDVEIESESVSEKGNSQRGKRKTSEQAVLSDSNTLSERQKKMVRFGGHSLEEDLEWSEPQIKDSGVDTCSSTTLNEEHSHSEKHPVTWQPSKDGERLIGRILLNKRLKDGSVPRDSGALLGLKVVGGKMTEFGRLCAFITKVKKGSLADTVGHLRPGDEVLEWNGRSLQGATFEEVYNIIFESKPEPQVELLVSRPIGDIPRIPDSTHGQLESSSSSFESQKMERPSISVTSPMSPGMLRDAPQFLPGQLSIKLWYDKVGHQLIVTILGAKDLPLREEGRPRNPYVKIYFLPDRSDKSKRRTKTVKKTLEPKWNQTFIYSPVHRREFRERMLEITLWDQARVREEESEFLGEILIELETALLDDEPHWYKLQTHDVSSMPLPQPSPYMPRRHPHGESPTRRLQRSQRISDSEVSDYDCDDGIGVVSSDYRHNGRDIQSSTLSVPEQVMSSNHCSQSGSSLRGDNMGRTRSRSPSVPPSQRSSELGPRSSRCSQQYNTISRMDRHRTQDDHYSPERESQYLTLPRSRHSHAIEHHHKDISNMYHIVYPLYREDAIRLLRSQKMNRAYSEGAYNVLERRIRQQRREPTVCFDDGTAHHPERRYNGGSHNAWSNHTIVNGTSDHYRLNSQLSLANRRTACPRIEIQQPSTDTDRSETVEVVPDHESHSEAEQNEPAEEMRNREESDRQEYQRSRPSEQRPVLERMNSRSRSSERAETNVMRSMPSLPSGRSAPPSPALTRSHLRGGSVQTSPTSTPVAGRRGRQLPQLPPKGSLERNNGEEGFDLYEEEDNEKTLEQLSEMEEDAEEKAHFTSDNGRKEELESPKRRNSEENDPEAEIWESGAMDVEERTRQMKMKMSKYKQVAASDSRLEQEYHSKHRLGRDSHRGSDNISNKSSDSDVSDVSAVSRTSSASRMSSTSYMSVQSEHPRTTRKIRRSKALEEKKEGGEEGEEEEAELEAEVEEEEGGKEERGGEEITQNEDKEKNQDLGEEDQPKEEECEQEECEQKENEREECEQEEYEQEECEQEECEQKENEQEECEQEECKEEQSEQEECEEETGTRQRKKEDLQRSSSENDVSKQMGTSGKNMTKSTSVIGDMYSMEKNDGSQSDTAVGTVATGSKKRRSSIGAKMVAIVGLSRRSRSTSQLSQTEAGGKKLRSTIQRSTETGLAVEMRNRMTRQPSRESADGSMNSYSSEGNLIFPGVRLASDSQFSDFLDGLGPAQMVGRQTLATPSMGDIQIGMMDKKGQLEVEVIRARGLVGKPGSKALPAPYVKVYLLENGICIAKKKTKVARKTLDPLYQQQLPFEDSPQGKVLQIIVWGDYGRMDHKSFMGVAQILLEELDLSNMVIGWYKLFPTSSLVDPTLAPLTRRASQSSLESSSGPSYARS